MACSWRQINTGRKRSDATADLREGHTGHKAVRPLYSARVDTPSPDSAPSSTPPAPGLAPAQDRLMTTLFLAALFHGIVILGVSFGVSGLNDPDTVPTLEVLLVNDDLPESRVNPGADYLAQRSQQGSGNTLEGRTANTPSSPLAFDNPGTAQGKALTDADAGRESDAPNLVAARGITGVRFGESAESNSGPRQQALLMQAGPQSALPSADTADQLTLKGKQQNELLITPNTRESDVAVYLDGWRRKVERIGTIHFPQEMRRRRGKSGSPVLEVAIRWNGQLSEALIRRSSGHPELDQAALSILKLATPFDPFPKELRERHSVLRFAYEWQFLGGEFVKSTVSSP